MDRSLVTLERMRSFVRVAERGSLSGVARELSVGQSTITRHLAELERGLGVALLFRTTRRLRLTPEGERFLEEARSILRHLDEAADDLRDPGGAATGIVRVSSTAALGIRHVSRGLFALQDRHPGLRIDLSLSDVRVDLVREAVDVAVRLGPLSDSALHRRVVGHSVRVLVASPAYLARHGRPRAAAALSAHAFVRMSNVAGSESLTLLGADGARQTVPVGGPLLVDHGLAAREAVLQGRGIGACHVWLVDDLLRSGAVVRVLPELGLEAMPCSLLFVPARARIARVRLVIDALASFLRTVPGFAVEDAGAAWGHAAAGAAEDGAA